MGIGVRSWSHFWGVSLQKFKNHQDRLVIEVRRAWRGAELEVEQVHLETGPRFRDWKGPTFWGYRGTSLIRNSAPLEHYSRPMPMALRWS